MEIADNTEVRFITEDEIDDYLQGVSRGFGSDPSEGDGHRERFLAINTLKATMAAFDRDRVVATFGSYDLDITVPGGSVAAAGTTHVTVHPTHRRRGILTKMMNLHLEQAIERGQLMAALWASEERIYGRFGYGPACFGLDLNITARTITLPPGPPDVGVHPLSEDEARGALPVVYDQVLACTPGLFVRSETWWAERLFRDPKEWRSGATSLRFVSAEREGQPVGYVAYRQRHAKDGELEGTIKIIELAAVDDDARRALWAFVTNVDLYRNVSWWNAPVDEPLLVEADCFRAVKSDVFDTMWLRLLDVPRVLEARRYERDGSIVIEVADEFLARGGRFRLDVKDGTARCALTDEPSEVTLDISDLSSLYLGGRSANTLARAGRIEGSAQAILTTGDLFQTVHLPYCNEVF